MRKLILTRDFVEKHEEDILKKIIEEDKATLEALQLLNKVNAKESVKEMIASKKSLIQTLKQELLKNDNKGLKLTIYSKIKSLEQEIKQLKQRFGL